MCIFFWAELTYPRAAPIDGLPDRLPHHVVQLERPGRVSVEAAFDCVLSTPKFSSTMLEPGNDSVIKTIQRTHAGGIMSFLPNTVNSPQLPKLAYPGTSLYQKAMKINSGILLGSHLPICVYFLCMKVRCICLHTNSCKCIYIYAMYMQAHTLTFWKKP